MRLSQLYTLGALLSTVFSASIPSAEDKHAHAISSPTNNGITDDGSSSPKSKRLEATYVGIQFPDDGGVLYEQTKLALNWELHRNGWPTASWSELGHPNNVAVVNIDRNSLYFVRGLLQSSDELRAHWAVVDSMDPDAVTISSEDVEAVIPNNEPPWTGKLEHHFPGEKLDKST